MLKIHAYKPSALLYKPFQIDAEASNGEHTKLFYVRSVQYAMHSRISVVYIYDVYSTRAHGMGEKGAKGMRAT